MEYFNFEDLVGDLKNLNEEQKYWMVRTMGGAYYGEFIRGNYIAVGYNNISLGDLQHLPETDNAAKEVLKAMFHHRYPDIRNSGYPVAQILRFARDIRQGDVVVIPSSGASHVAIGIIDGNMYEENTPIIDDEHHCDFKKRRHIKWRYFGRRATLPPALQLMFTSRHILSDVSNYASYIDSVIHDCYVKEDVMNLVLKIRTQKEVSLDDFCDLKAVSLLIDDFCQNYNISSEAPLNMKVQMESPGWLRLSTKGIGKLLLFGLFTTILTGGGVKFNKKDGLDIYTNGIGGIINDYLDRKADRELVRAAARAMDSLQIKTPEDMQPIIEILNAKNEGRRNY